MLQLDIFLCAAIGYLFWQGSKANNKQMLLGRRILALDVPELRNELMEGPLERDSIAQGIKLLRDRIPELRDPKKMAWFLDSRGLTFNEMKIVFAVLNDEIKPPH